jgi:pimeloyl-ACP methyl ester carboxylesterase
MKKSKRLKKALGITAAFLIFIIIAGFIYEAVAFRINRKEFPMPGKLVDAGGYKLHLNVKGEGAYTIIFEAGSGETSLSWGEIPEELSSYARIVSYDRAGYAWSEKAETERSGYHIVHELYSALQQEGIKGPYILVGHSLGGMYLRLFAEEYREEVAGLVLVDARPEDDEEQTASIYAKEHYVQKPSASILSLLKQSGIMRLFQNSLLEGMVPAEERKFFINVIATPEYFQAVDEEGKHSADVEDAIRDQWLGELPVKVIARGIAPDYKSFGISEQSGQKIEEIWRKGQLGMLSISGDSEFIEAEKSGHMVMKDEPELVLKVIQKLLYELEEKENK